MRRTLTLALLVLALPSACGGTKGDTDGASDGTSVGTSGGTTDTQGASTGTDSGETGTGTTESHDTCTLFEAPSPGVAWSYTCSTSQAVQNPTVGVYGDAIAFAFQFGDPNEPPLPHGIDFGEGLHHAEGPAIAVTSLTPDGALVWGQLVGTSKHTQFLQAVAPLNGGAMAVTGDSFGPFELGGVPINIDPSARFLAVLDDEDALRWSRELPSDANGYIDAYPHAGLAGAVVVSGNLRGTVEYSGVELGAQDEDGDAYLAVHEPDGSLRFARTFSGTGTQYIRDVDVGANGQILVVAQGAFGELAVGNLPPLTGSAFLVQISSDGEIESAIGFPGNMYGKSVALAANGDMIMGGDFLETINLGGDDLVNADTNPDYEETRYDVFVARFTASGEHVWSVRMGDGDSNENIHDVKIDALGRVRVAWGGRHVSEITSDGVLAAILEAPVGGLVVALDNDNGVLLTAEKPGVIDDPEIDLWLTRFELE